MTLIHEIQPSGWDLKFMRLALHIADWSKDRSRKVGCVITGQRNEIRSTGYNGFPRKINDNDESRHERPQKYLWTEHAERNAIYNAAAVGIPLEGCTMYVPWYPCIDCARALIQVGISQLVAIEPDWKDSKWGENFIITQELLNEYNLQVRLFTSLAIFGLKNKNNCLSKQELISTD